jgi:hypothetical protein
MNTSEFEDIRSIEDLEMVSETTIWQNFERLTAFIFEKNDFTVNVNTVKTGNRKKRQYDVISWKDNQTFLVECKKWAGSRYRLSALKKAVEQHKERTAFYENIMNEDTIPVVVTLVEEEIHVYEGVPIVPILKLNSFIRESDGHGPGDFFYDYEDILPSPGDMPAGVSVFPEQDGGEPCEGGAGNACQGEIPGQDRLFPKRGYKTACDTYCRKEIS